MKVNLLLKQQLLDAGYTENPVGVFRAPIGKRTVVLIDAPPEPEAWPELLDRGLKKVGILPAWSSYLIIIVDSVKTVDLSLAAVAFTRDVSRCRKIVFFNDTKNEPIVPFLPLPSIPGGDGNAGSDFHEMSNKHLQSQNVTAAFLDDSKPLTLIQDLVDKEDK